MPYLRYHVRFHHADNVGGYFWQDLPFDNQKISHYHVNVSAQGQGKPDYLFPPCHFIVLDIMTLEYKTVSGEPEINDTMVYFMSII